MPIVRTSLLRERSPTETRALADGVYAALRATFAVQEDDRFVLVDRRRPGDPSHGASHLGRVRGDDLVTVRIVCDAGRTIARKTALPVAIAENFGRAGGRGDGVFVNLVEGATENRSYRRGLARCGAVPTGLSAGGGDAMVGAMNFSSDTWAGASEPVLAALLAAGRGGPAPAYGADPTTKRLEARFSELFERDVAVFLVTTGSAANALAVAASTPPWGAVVAHEEAHLAIDECGAPEFFSGARVLRWPAARGKFTPEDLDRRLSEAPRGLHHGELSVMSLTSPNEYGLVWSPAEMTAVTGVAKAHGLSVHLDGARFANAIARLGCSPAEATWKAGVDVMSFGATKGGCLMGEAIVAFDLSLRERLAYLRKRAGQLVAKQRLVSAQFEAWLADGHWLMLAAHANAKASELAEVCARADGMRLAWTPQANEVFVFMGAARAAALEAGGARFHEWSTAALIGDDRPGAGEVLCRFVTSFATTDAEIAAFADLLAA